MEVSEVCSGAHLVEHVVEAVGQRLDVFAVEWRDDRRLQATANEPHHLVACRSAATMVSTRSGLIGKRGHQFPELHRHVHGG